jgi:tetratricopeptide (TPR) repeat protein
LALEAEGNYSEAANAYNISMGIDPKYNQAMRNMMHALLALKKYDDAMKIYIRF